MSGEREEVREGDRGKKKKKVGGRECGGGKGTEERL